MMRESVRPALVRRGITGIVLARLAVNGGIRVVYPFLTLVAAGVGLSFQTLAILVASRSLAGLVGPPVARAMSRFRWRSMMLLAQAVVAAGCLLIAASSLLPAGQRTPAVVVGFLATGLARPLFDLPMQSWVSARVPLDRRGRAMGLTELGWALSLAATVPLATVLVGPLGWRSPFLVVAALAGVGAIALVVMVPPTEVVTRPIANIRRSYRSGPDARRICLAAALAVASGEGLLVVYGEWLGQDLGLSIVQIGATTLVIVAAELMGEAVVLALADRAGLRRSLGWATVVSVAAYAGLGLVGRSVGLALLAVLIVFVAFEVTIVVLIALASTVGRDAEDRGRILGALMASVAGGNAVGAVVAPVLFALGGMALTGTAAAVCTTAAVLVVAVGRRGRPRPAYADICIADSGGPRVELVTVASLREAEADRAGAVTP